MKNDSTYIVEDNNLFGYTLSEPKDNKPTSMVVMAADIEKGGEPTLIGRTTLATDYRQATEEDASRFGVNIEWFMCLICVS